MNVVISIIIPVFNSEEKIKRCIKSILNQSFDDFEIIIIDDGSADKTGSICDYFAQVDKRIKVIHIENNGVSNARNIGIDKAEGKYLMFVDSDDYIDELMLETYIRDLEEKQLDICIGSINIIENNKIKTYKIFDDEEIDSKKFWNLLGEDLSVLGYVWGKLFRTDLIKKNHLSFDTDMYSQEDLNFNLSYYDKCKKFGFISYIGYIYDFEAGKRRPPYLDFIRNQIKIYELIDKHTNVSKKVQDVINTKINLFLFNYLFDSVNKSKFNEKIVKLCNFREFTTYLSVQNNLLDNYFYLKEFYKKHFRVLYLYISILKLKSIIKRLIRRFI